MNWKISRERYLPLDWLGEGTIELVVQRADR
jgi:hypothetical protein